MEKQNKSLRRKAMKEFWERDPENKTDDTNESPYIEDGEEFADYEFEVTEEEGELFK